MIRHKTARRIASEWHNGQSTALYALASTGAIQWPVDEELKLCQAHAPKGKPWIELAKLRGYVRFSGERGPIEGWSR
jgi:hypothetical protein